MSARTKGQKKVRIGGTIDSDVASWLMKTKGKEKFSSHLNNVLKNAMETSSGGYKQSGKEAASLVKMKATLDNLAGWIKKLQGRIDSLESRVSVKKAAKPGEEKVKRPRGRPRKARAPAAAEMEGLTSEQNWFMSRDKYKKIKPDVMSRALEMVQKAFEGSDTVTVGSVKESYDQSNIGVPYPTFRLFYFPLIRDYLLDKKMIEKVDKAGKKGVYKKRE